LIVGCSGRREFARLLSVFVDFPFLIEDRFERVVAEVAAADEPLVVLFDDDAGGEPDQRAVVGEDADDVGAATDLAVDALERVGIPYERRWMPAVTLDRLDARCGVRVGEYGATVRDGGIRERTQDGQAVVTRWAASPC
jgi:hypothetical protein